MGTEKAPALWGTTHSAGTAAPPGAAEAGSATHFDLRRQIQGSAQKGPHGAAFSLAALPQGRQPPYSEAAGTAAPVAGPGNGPYHPCQTRGWLWEPSLRLPDLPLKIK